MIIGIAGKAGSGKDTVAVRLRNSGFTRVAFGDPVKQSAQAMFGLSEEETWSTELKEVPIPYWGISPRQMFQMVGTDMARNVYHQNIWTMRWLRAARDIERVCVPDVRFDNEADLIRDMGGLIVHLHRHDAVPVNAHVSENGVLFKSGDIDLYNDGTLADLFYVVDKIASDFIESVRVKK